MDLLGWGQQAELQGAFCSIPPFPAGYFPVLLGGGGVVLGCL